jgi:hypothetical protein
MPYSDDKLTCDAPFTSICVKCRRPSCHIVRWEGVFFFFFSPDERTILVHEIKSKRQEKHAGKHFVDLLTDPEDTEQQRVASHVAQAYGYAVSPLCHTSWFDYSPSPDKSRPDIHAKWHVQQVLLRFPAVMPQAVTNCDYLLYCNDSATLTNPLYTQHNVY